MDFLQLVLSRQSDRAYDKSARWEAGRSWSAFWKRCSSGSFCLQCFAAMGFVVVTDHELASKVGKAAAGLGMNKFIKMPPVHILVVKEGILTNITSLLGGKVKAAFPLIDIGIAAAHITLAAENEGLEFLHLGWFDEKRDQRLTGIPASKRLLY